MGNEFRVPQSILYAAGHPQANQNVMVAVGQTLFTLEHNSLAEDVIILIFLHIIILLIFKWFLKLEELHPNWSAEKVFWEARKWNIAQFQAIAFNEYIPALVCYFHIKVIDNNIHLKI